MADAGDLKSLALDGRAGSSPALAIFHRSPERFFVRGFFCRRFERFFAAFEALLGGNGSGAPLLKFSQLTRLLSFFGSTRLIGR